MDIRYTGQPSPLCISNDIRFSICFILRYIFRSHRERYIHEVSRLRGLPGTRCWWYTGRTAAGYPGTAHGSVLLAVHAQVLDPVLGTGTSSPLG